MIPTLISLLTYLVQAVISVTSWLHERQLVESGVANQQLSDIKDTLDEVQQAVAARDAVKPISGMPNNSDPYAPYRD